MMLIAIAVMVSSLLFVLITLSRRPALQIEGEDVDVWIRQLASPTWKDDAKRALTAAGLPVLPHLAQAFEKVDTLSHRAQSKLHNFNDATAQAVNAPFPWEKVRLDLAEIMGIVGSNYRFEHRSTEAPLPRELQIAVDCLTRGLKDKNDSIRVWCAQELWRIGPNARSAVPALLQALQNGDVRATTTLRALAIIGPGAYTNEVLQAMENALRSKDREVRWAAVDALSGLSDNAAPAVPALIDVLNGNDRPVADTALRTLARIGHLPKELKPKLETLMDSEDDFRRAGAAVALLRIEQQNSRALALVRDCLATNRPNNVRSSTAYLLAGMGRDAKTFETELKNLAQDAEPNVKTFARDALNAMQADPQAQ